MKHSELVLRAGAWLRSKHRCPVVLCEINTRLPFVPDALGLLRTGVSHHVECKASRSDFLSDKKKLHRRNDDYLIGDYVWYLTAPGVADVEEIPDPWGLAVVAGPNRIRVEKIAKRRSHRDSRLETQILVSAIVRHQIGVQWYSETYRFEPYLGKPPPKRKTRSKE